jgi:hypothetical protein
MTLLYIHVFRSHSDAIQHLGIEHTVTNHHDELLPVGPVFPVGLFALVYLTLSLASPSLCVSSGETFQQE